MHMCALLVMFDYLCSFGLSEVDTPLVGEWYELAGWLVGW